MIATLVHHILLSIHIITMNKIRIVHHITYMNILHLCIVSMYVNALCNLLRAHESNIYSYTIRNICLWYCVDHCSLTSVQDVYLYHGIITCTLPWWDHRVLGCGHHQMVKIHSAGHKAILPYSKHQPTVHKFTTD